jgi:hypothetical protein
VKEDMWYDAEIKAILPGDKYMVLFTDATTEVELGLSHMKIKTKSVRLADIMGADFKGSQTFTDFVINGVKTGTCI